MNKHICLVDDNPISNLNKRRLGKIITEIDDVGANQEASLIEGIFEVCMVACYNASLSRESFDDLVNHSRFIEDLLYHVFELISQEALEQIIADEDGEDGIVRYVEYWCRYYSYLNIPGVLSKHNIVDGFIEFEECSGAHLLEKDGVTVIEFSLEPTISAIPENIIADGEYTVADINEVRISLKGAISEKGIQDIIDDIGYQWAEKVRRLCGDGKAIAKEYPKIIEGLNDPDSIYYHADLTPLDGLVGCDCGFDLCALNALQYVYDNLPARVRLGNY